VGGGGQRENFVMIFEYVIFAVGSFDEKLSWKISGTVPLMHVTNPDHKKGRHFYIFCSRFAFFWQIFFCKNKDNQEVLTKKITFPIFKKMYRFKKRFFKREQWGQIN
jgi:hypothetical protein